MAVSLYQLPYDDRDERPEEAPTLLSVAEVLNTTSSKVRKLLITADFFTSEKSREINSLSEQGLSLTEIAERMELTKATVCDYLPYSRGVYNLEDATLSILFSYFLHTVSIKKLIGNQVNTFHGGL